MKYANVIITVIVAAAVLIAAYAIGLLVRQARAPHADSQSAVAGANDVTPPIHVGPGQDRMQSVGKPTPAEVKQQREETLEKMGNLTEKQKQEFREGVRNRFSGGDGRGRYRGLSPEERQKLQQKLESMSPEERKAYLAQTEERLRTSYPRRQTAPSQTPQDGNTVAEQNKKETEAGSDPNSEAGPR